MDEKERTEWLTVKLAEGQTTPELVAQGLSLMGVPIEAPAEPAEETHEKRPTAKKSEHPTQDPPNEGEVPEELIAGAEILVFRALERAGNRLKNRVNGHVPAKTSAAKLYLRLPTLSEAEITAVLDDAWTCIDDFSLPSDTDTLVRTLDAYTRTLLMLRKAPDRALLREHLAMMRLEHPASV
jgi:hypothetical protein